MRWFIAGLAIGILMGYRWATARWPAVRLRAASPWPATSRQSVQSTTVAPESPAWLPRPSSQPTRAAHIPPPPRETHAERNAGTPSALTPPDQQAPLMASAV